MCMYITNWADNIVYITKLIILAWIILVAMVAQVAKVAQVEMDSSSA